MSFRIAYPYITNRFHKLSENKKNMQQYPHIKKKNTSLFVQIFYRWFFFFYNLTRNNIKSDWCNMHAIFSCFKPLQLSLQSSDHHDWPTDHLGVKSGHRAHSTCVEFLNRGRIVKQTDRRAHTYIHKQRHNTETHTQYCFLYASEEEIRKSA